MYAVPAMHRPSTSPVPTFFTAQRPRNPRGAGAAIPSIPGLPRGRAPGTAVGGRRAISSLICIEGHTTGEEKAVSAIDRRESLVNVPRRSLSGSCLGTSAAAAPPEGSAAGEADAVDASVAAMRAKEQQKLRRAQELLKRRTAERDMASGERDEQQAVAATLRQRLGDLEASAESEAARLGAKVADLEDQLLKQRSAADRRQSSSDVERQRLADAMAQLAASFDKEKEAAIEREKQDASAREALESDFRRSKEELRSISAAMQRGDGEVGKQREAAESAAAAHRRAVADLTERLHQAESLAAERSAELDRWRSRIDGVDEYIVSICQPQFSVVKDDSLEPMPPDDPKAKESGFVLVPLKLMLAGYGLLRSDSKARIASDYDEIKKKQAREAAKL